MRCVLAVVLLAACYHPSYEDCQLACTSFGCPDGLTCNNGMCRTASAVGECALRPPGDGGTDGDSDGSSSSGGAAQIIAGAHHTCAACGDGSLWCWGADDKGQTSGSARSQCNASAPGPDCDPTPVRVTLPGSLKGLAAGASSTCVLADISGTTQLFCMGDNSTGQFGIPSPSSSQSLTETGITGVTAYAGGGQHACEISAGRIECQGLNQVGQLGNGGVNTTPIPSPMLTIPEVDPVQIATGRQHTCAAVPNTSPFCWGDNSHGEVTASPTGNPVTTPHQNPVVPRADEIAAGAGHTCMVGDGSVVCWGENDLGQVGTGSNTNTAGVTLVQVNEAAHITAGGTQSCALTLGGAVYCWGGVDASSSHNTPTQVALPVAATAITAGTAHACALLMDRTVWCWGTNVNGELGNGTPDAQDHMPAQAHVCE